MDIQASKLVAEKLATPQAAAAFVVSPLLVFFFGLVLIALLYEIWRRNTREYRLMKNIPAEREWPLLGHAQLVLGKNNVEIVEVLLQILRRVGETVRANLGHIPVVVLTNPSDIEIVLSSQKHLEKSVEYRYFQPWFGKGLLISKGQHWRHHRKMIAPTFHQSILRSFVPTFVKHSKAVVERMYSTVGQEFDVHKYMSETTVDILLTTAMGMKKQPATEKSAAYAQAVMDMCDILHQRQLKIFYRMDATYNLTKMRDRDNKLLKIIKSMTSKVVEERMRDFNADERAVIDKNDKNDPAGKPAKKADGLRDDLDDIDENDVGEKKRLALLDAMMQMEKDPNIQWTEQDVIDEVNTIMFEGHDTTAAGSSFTLCMLGIEQDMQQRVYEEQQSIFGDDMLRDCTFSDTLQMHYLERVICESLRMFPPVPVIARKAEEDIQLTSGPYTIAKGTTIVISQFAVHRRPDFYPEPQKFDPDRFLPERSAQRHFYSYIPFSAGPRSCVGRKFAMLQLKVLLSTILRHYKIHSGRTTDDFKLQGDIILKLANGFFIHLEPRVQQILQKKMD